MDQPAPSFDHSLKIEQVVPGIDRLDAGPTYSVTRLSEEIAHSANVTLHTLEPRPARLPNVATRFYPRVRIAAQLGISPRMKQGLKNAASTSDVMHFHGLWTMPSVYPEAAVRGTDCALVMSPRGMLDPWALAWSARRKAIFGKLFQSRALEAVACFHATSSLEEEAIRAAGYRAPIAIIPIGIDIPELVVKPAPQRRTVLYLGRLHPIKNVDGLLLSWTAIENRHKDWTLLIAGPGEHAYVDTLRGIAGGTERVEFLGPVYGEAKANLLSTANLFVLPTHTENFGIVVAEALSYGVPVISSTGAPWEALERNGCGWWTPNDEGTLTSVLDGALSWDASTLTKMGRRGREWMEREFAWSDVANSTIATYQWLNSGGPQPTHVHTA